MRQLFVRNWQELLCADVGCLLCGQVFVLVELLHTVTTTFDKYRAVRYQRSLERELQQHRKMPQVSTGLLSSYIKTCEPQGCTSQGRWAAF